MYLSSFIFGRVAQVAGWKTTWKLSQSDFLLLTCFVYITISVATTMDKNNVKIFSCSQKIFPCPLTPLCQCCINHKSHWCTSKASPATFKRGGRGYRKFVWFFSKYIVSMVAVLFPCFIYNFFIHICFGLDETKLTKGKLYGE